MELAVGLFLSYCTSLPHQLLMLIEKTPRASLPQLPQALLLHQMLESLHRLWGLLQDLLQRAHVPTCPLYWGAQNGTQHPQESLISAEQRVQKI